MTSFYTGRGIGEYVLEAGDRVKVVGVGEFDGTDVYIIQRGNGGGGYYLKEESDGQAIDEPIDGDYLKRVE